MQTEMKAAYWRLYEKYNKITSITLVVRIALSLGILPFLPTIQSISVENVGDNTGLLIFASIILGAFVTLPWMEVALSSMLPKPKCVHCGHHLRRHENKKGEVFTHCKYRTLSDLIKKQSCSCTHFE